MFSTFPVLSWLCALWPSRKHTRRARGRTTIDFILEGRIYQCCAWFVHKFHRGLGEEEWLGMCCEALSFSPWHKGVPEAAGPDPVTLSLAQVTPARRALLWQVAGDHGSVQRSGSRESTQADSPGGERSLHCLSSRSWLNVFGPALHDLILSSDINTSAKWVLNGAVSVCSMVLHPLEKCKWFYKVQGTGKSAFPRLQLAGEIQINSCGIQFLPKSSFLSQVLQVFFYCSYKHNNWMAGVFIY